MIITYSTLTVTKAERITFRRHFPAWMGMSLRGPARKVYVRLGDRFHLWVASPSLRKQLR